MEVNGDLGDNLKVVHFLKINKSPSALMNNVSELIEGIVQSDVCQGLVKDNV